MRAWPLCFIVLLSAACCTVRSSAPPTEPAPAPVAAPAQDFNALVAQSDRSADDRALDAGRHPAQLLAFLGLKPGMQVGEVTAAGGYTTELMARAVGPQGKVYGENPNAILARFAEVPWSARLKKPVMSNVVREDREIDSPFPESVTGLDAVINVLFYHDTVWLKVDRAKMNRSIFNALKPGGIYVIVDHSGRPGTGVTEANTLHRIEESVLRSEVESAGFKLLESADFLRNPNDARDWSASPRTAGEKRGTSDRFVLKFVRP